MPAWLNLDDAAAHIDVDPRTVTALAAAWRTTTECGETLYALEDVERTALRLTHTPTEGTTTWAAPSHSAR